MEANELIAALALTGLHAAASAASTVVSDRVPFLGAVLRVLALNFGKAANDPTRQ